MLQRAATPPQEPDDPATSDTSCLQPERYPAAEKRFSLEIYRNPLRSSNFATFPSVHRARIEIAVVTVSSFRISSNTLARDTVRL